MRNSLKVLFMLSLLFIHTSTASAQVNSKTTVYKNAVLSSNAVVVKSEVPKPTKAVLPKKKTTASRSEDIADKIIRRGLGVLGTPYKYGSSGTSSFDCSGFTAYAYSISGTTLPHSSAAQAKLGKHVDKSDLQKGDLVIFNNPANTKIGHVGIYIGNNNFLHASTNEGVTTTSLDSSYYAKRYVTARRILE